MGEAHEKTVASDMLLAMVKHACKRRPNLKLIVMSATRNAEKFRAYFNAAPILTIPGRTHPVTVFHTATTPTAFGDELHTTVPQYRALPATSKSTGAASLSPYNLGGRLAAPRP